VTDAALELGMLAEGSLASGLQLDADLASNALDTLGGALALPTPQVAAGIMRVAAARMSDAIFEISVERGLDPREGSLMVFGGAGGLFATLLAREAEVRSIIIPPYCGNFSAWGLMGADITQTAARTEIMPLVGESAVAARRVLAELLAGLGQRPGNASLTDGLPEASLDLRYKGQEYSLTIAAPTLQPGERGDVKEIADRFEHEYESVFGHRMDEEIEVVAVRATLRAQLPREHTEATSQADGAPAAGAKRRAWSFTHGTYTDFLLLDRGSLAPGVTLVGPALIREETAMTYLDIGFSLTIDDTGCLFIRDDEGSSQRG